MQWTLRRAILNVVYDGHLRNTENIGYDVFQSFTVASALELPAGIITFLSTEGLGRRHTSVWSLLLGGIIGLSIALVSVGKRILHDLISLSSYARVVCSIISHNVRDIIYCPFSQVFHYQLKRICMHICQRSCRYI